MGEDHRSNEVVERLTFRQCTRARLESLFGLRRVLTSSGLDHWLSMRPPISTEEKVMLKHLQQLLFLNNEAWNEQELSLNFIGPVFALVAFTELYRFNHFANRHIKAVVSSAKGEIELKGEPDGLIATGYWEPEIPIFAFSEYKRNLDPDGDPGGQALAAMLVGQVLNKQPHPIYGCYVIGNHWTFLVLEDKSYTFSRDFSATTDEIFDIFRILKALKEIIMALTAE